MARAFSLSPACHVASSDEFYVVMYIHQHTDNAQLVFNTITAIDNYVYEKSMKRFWKFADI